MKKLSLILLSVIMTVALVACGDVECEHRYDNACDVTCNECGEERTVTHDYIDADCDTPKTCSACGATDGEALGHTWTAADCDTPKTCSVCKTTEGEALGHTPGNEDNDCSTALNCGACGEEILAAAEHTPERDDGNCTTARKCSACAQIAIPAVAAHSDADHDYLCDNAGCQVTVGNPPEDKNPGIDLPIDRN